MLPMLGWPHLPHLTYSVGGFYSRDEDFLSPCSVSGAGLHAEISLWVRHESQRNDNEPPWYWGSIHLALTGHSNKMAEFFSYLWVSLLGVLQAFYQGCGSYWTARHEKHVELTGEYCVYSRTAYVRPYRALWRERHNRAGAILSLKSEKCFSFVQSRKAFWRY